MLLSLNSFLLPLLSIPTFVVVIHTTENTVMPPRLELTVMRTLQLSYVQARDLVKDSRDELSMKSTDPWTEELKEYCTTLYNERLASGYYQTPIIVSNDDNDISDIINSTESTGTKDNKRKDGNDNEKCGGEDDDDDDAKEIEIEVGSIVLDIDDDDGYISADESQSLSKPSKERNDNNEYNENYDDDDNDENIDIRNLLLRIPSKRSIFNHSDPSMWVQPGSGSIIDSAYSVDENGKPKDDYDDIEKFMNHCLKIRTSNKKFQSNNSTTDVSGGDGDDSNRRGDTEQQQQQQQQRSSSRLNDIPKFVYVVTVNDVPLGVIVEQMKKNCMMLRQSGGGTTGSNHDTTTGGMKIKSKPRSRSLSLGRKSFHKKFASTNNNDDSNSNSHNDGDSNNNNSNKDYTKSPTVIRRTMKGLCNQLSPNNNTKSTDDDDEENKGPLSPTKRIKKLVRGRSVSKNRMKMTPTTTTNDETEGTTATTNTTKSPLMSIQLLTQQNTSPTKKKRSISLGRRNFMETLQSSIGNLGIGSSRKINSYDNDDDGDDDGIDDHENDNDNNKYDMNDYENTTTSTTAIPNTNRKEQQKEDRIVVDKKTRNVIPVLSVS